MKCPRCYSDMIDGLACVKAPAIIETQVYASWKKQSLWFIPDTGERSLVMFGSQPRDAVRCSGCNTVFIPGSIPGTHGS